MSNLKANKETLSRKAIKKSLVKPKKDYPIKNFLKNIR